MNFAKIRGRIKEIYGSEKNFAKELNFSKVKLRKDQEHFLKIMKEYGAITGVARSVEDARRIISEKPIC